MTHSSPDGISLRTLIALFLAAQVSACGSDGGDSGNGADGGAKSYTVGGAVSGLNGTVVLQNNAGDDLELNANGPFAFATPVPDGAAYAVTVLTQPDGQTCTASRNAGTVSGGNVSNVSIVCADDAQANTYTIGGTVTGLNGTVVLQNNAGDDLALHSNGPFTFATPVTDGATYLVTVRTQPAYQACVVNNRAGTVAGISVTSVTVTCSRKPLALATFQAASVVIGQADFTSRVSAVSDGNFSMLYGNPTTHNGVLYLPDRNSSRILGFNGVPGANGAAASFVLGQATFTSSADGQAANQLNRPQSTWIYDGKLFVVDTENHRVLIWNSAPAATQAPADIVVGWDNLETPASGCALTRLYRPGSVFAAAGKLFVADTYNHRVLIWNTIPSASGAPADLILGQSDSGHCVGNDDDQNQFTDAGPSARTLSYPLDVWSDGNRIIVADGINSRVLIWNAFPVANFAPANVVLGHDTFDNGGPNNGDDGTPPTAQTLAIPSAVRLVANQLFVADAGNNRVLVWNVLPTANFAPADVVLGQNSFDKEMQNDDNQDNVPDATPSARTFFAPRGLHVFEDKLLVTDGANLRYLIFRSQQ